MIILDEEYLERTMRSSRALSISDLLEELDLLKASGPVGMINQIFLKKNLLSKYKIEIPSELTSIQSKVAKASTLEEFVKANEEFNLVCYSFLGAMRRAIMLVDTNNNKVDAQNLAELKKDLEKGISSTLTDLDELKLEVTQDGPAQELVADMISDSGAETLLTTALLTNISDLSRYMDSYIKRLDVFIRYKMGQNGFDKNDRYLIANNLFNGLIDIKLFLEKKHSLDEKVAVIKGIKSLFEAAVNAVSTPDQPLERGLKSKASKFFSGVPSLVDILADYQKKDSKHISHILVSMSMYHEKLLDVRQNSIKQPRSSLGYT